MFTCDCCSRTFDDFDDGDIIEVSPGVMAPVCYGCIRKR